MSKIKYDAPKCTVGEVLVVYSMSKINYGAPDGPEGVQTFLGLLCLLLGCLGEIALLLSTRL